MAGLSPLTGLLGSSLMDSPTLTTPALLQWSHVERRFQRFLTNIEPTALQHEDVWTKVNGVVACLNRHYWLGLLSAGEVAGILAGSWAKGTRARPSSDLDLIYLLPWPVFHRFEQRTGNRQSAILQEVANVLAAAYPTTDIRCDGPTVIMNFSTYKIEIAPAFRESTAPAYIDNQQFKAWLCDTKEGGRYKLVAPAADRGQVVRLDALWKGDLAALIRMAKTWKRTCNVPIRSFYLEQMAIEFLAQWGNTGKGPFWYDWMIRDFFAFMLTRGNGQGALPVSNEPFFYGDAWASRTETAARNAARACISEQQGLNAAAGAEWQKIFGTMIPRDGS